MPITAEIRGKVAGMSEKSLDESIQVALSCPVATFLWVQDHCKIIDKYNKLVDLCYNAAQVHTDQVLGEMRDAGLPVRLVVLKARQLGESSRSLAHIYRNVCLQPNRQALVSAHDNDSSIKLFRKIKLFQDHNPEALSCRYSTRKEIIFEEPHRGEILVETAGKEDLGRSATISDFHGSEVAYWESPDNTMLSVSQCVPNTSDTMVILESTANGVGGYFYNTYRKARKAECDNGLSYMSMPVPRSEEWNGYYRVFNPWFISDEYRMAVQLGFKRSEEEQGLAEVYGLDDEQLQWRRVIINEKCNGDPELFKQEYPSNDIECFLVSGRPVFNPVAVEKLSRVCCEPRVVGQLYEHEEIGVSVSDRLGGRWLEIWDEPRHGQIYAIGADPAEGLDPEKSNDPDAHSIHVIWVRTGQAVAKINSHCDVETFAEQLDLLGRWYNDALIGVEVNNTSGGAVRQRLKDLNYPNMFYREVYDKTADEPTVRLGWETNKATRGIMLMELSEAINKVHIHVFSAQSVEQLRMFRYDKDGKACAPPGEHDDDVMSLAIAWQMAAAAGEAGARELADTAGEVISAGGEDFRPDYLIGGCEGDDTEEIEMALAEDGYYE